VSTAPTTSSSAVSNTANLTSGSITYNAYIAKYNTAGTLLWARALRGTGGAYLRGLRIDGSGNVIVAGTFHGTIDFDPNILGTQNRTAGANGSLFFAKYNSSGSLVWVNVLTPTGGAWYPSIALHLNNVVLSVSFSGTVDADPGTGVVNRAGLGSAGTPNALFIGKYSSAGAHMWSRAVVGAGNDPWGVGNGIAVDGFGDVYVTGQFVGSTTFGGPPLNAFGATDAFVAKYSANNASLWSIQLGGAGDETGAAIAVNNQLGVYVSGHYYHHGDYHPSPSVTATLTHAGPAGSQPDAFFAKFTTDGGFGWAHAISTEPQDYVTDVTIKGTNIFINGLTHGTVDFDFGAGSAPLAFAGFGAKYADETTPNPNTPTASCYPMGSITGCSAQNLPNLSPLEFTWTSSSGSLQIVYPSSGSFPYTTSNGVIYFGQHNGTALGPCPSGTQISYTVRYNGQSIGSASANCP
jgi:hypothetical protein